MPCGLNCCAECIHEWNGADDGDDGDDDDDDGDDDNDDGDDDDDDDDHFLENLATQPNCGGGRNYDC